MIRYIAIFCLLTAEAQAEAVKLSGDGIRKALSDKILVATDGQIEQIFQASGQTVYIEAGNASQGTWFVESDQYCSRWPPSNIATCYDVLQDGEMITFNSANGRVYQMKTKSPRQ
jgi:hypothetical protein